MTDTAEQHVKDSTRHLGLTLDPAGSQVVIAGRAATAPDPKTVIPPAALLPRLPMEPVRADVLYPPHVRGTAHDWPPEAVVDHQTGGGRFPLLHAWHMLAVEEPRAWVWKRGDETMLATASAAIAAAAAHLIRNSENTGGSATLVIPDRLRMAYQEQILDSIAGFGYSLRLLWRSVAAALPWCSRNHRLLEQAVSGSRKALGSLAVLYLGLDEWDFSVLEIVIDAKGEPCLLPARRRPVGSAFPGLGLELVVRLAYRHLQDVHTISDATTLWQLLWCSAWVPEMLTALRHPKGASREFATLLASTGASISALGRTGWRQDLLGQRFLLPEATAEQYSQWQKQITDISKGKQLLGVVFAGPFAGVQLPNGKTWGTEILQRCGVPVVAGDARSDCWDDCSITATGAAMYSQCVSEQKPSYLDTLPRLKTAMYVGGVPGWVDLIDTNEYVDGGKRWRRETPLSGLRLIEGKSKLVVSVQHEEHQTVRSVVASFPAPLPRTVSMKLEVSALPAQGNAQLEVIPDDPKLFGTKRVFIEWKTMRDLACGPEEALAKLPTLFPQLLRRAFSKRRLQATEHAMQRYLQRPGPKSLKNVVEELRGKEQLSKKWQHYESFASAFSSEGETAYPSEISATFLRSLTDDLNSIGRAIEADLIRALAYTSTSDPALERYLARAIHDEKQPMEQPELAACGWCLRDPRLIAEFSNLLLRKLQIPDFGPTNWLKAFGEILRYRENATRIISSEKCLDVLTAISGIFASEMRQGRFETTFKCSSICLVFLLRRRAYDDEFLMPTSPKARETALLFAKAVKRVSSTGGAVSLSGALLTMIKYLNREGPPVIQAGSEFGALVE